MLWLCLFLPRLPLEIYSRAAPGREPLAVSEGRGRVETVLAANPAACARGVVPGMHVSAARALAGDLAVKPRDRAAEREALAQLAGWAGGFTSLVSLAEPDALLLEVAGSSAFFGGLAALRARIETEVDALGFGVVTALAPTPLAASLLARGGGETTVTDMRALFAALAPLPLSCLRLTAEREALLTGMGLRCLADCLRLPRDGLARRVGPETLIVLDRALGRRPDVRAPYEPPTQFNARLALPAPVDTVEALLFPLHRLFLDLRALLSARAAGVSDFTLTLDHLKGPATDIEFKFTAPTRDAEHWVVLARERLQRCALTQPVEEIELCAKTLQPLAAHTADIFAGTRPPPAARAQLIERLRARLGDSAVRGLDHVADHRPERAWGFREPGTPPACADIPVHVTRPLWLLPAPLPLEERAGRPWLDGNLMLVPERERIENGWWDGGDIARDYFVAHDARGARYWIYRDLDDAQRRWFLHGVFA